MSGFLDRLERRTNRAYWSDGLLDLLCSVALLALGVSWLLGSHVYGAIVPALLVPLWGPLRARFTRPRLGQVELARAREDRNRGFLRLTLVAGVLAFALAIGVHLLHARGLGIARVLVPALPGLLIGLGAVATAEALGLARFFVYGGLSIAAGLGIAIATELDPGWGFLVTGASMLAGGAALAVRFVRRYPGEETSDEPRG